jgi:phage/plasmid-associated DNA primase
VFLEENYVEGFEFDADSTSSPQGIPCGEMYQAYSAWCNQNGYHPLNASNFGKEVKRAFANVTKEQRRQRGMRVAIYSGLAVKEESEVAGGNLARCQQWQ